MSTMPLPSAPASLGRFEDEIAHIPGDRFDDPAVHEEILVVLPEEGPDAGRADGTLSPAAERHLFRKMNFLKYRAERLRRAIVAGDAPAGAADRLRAKLRDAAAIREELILSNTRLVTYVAKRFADRRTPLEDLVAAGQPTLIRSVDLFDYSRGFRFSTYAAWALRNYFVRLVNRRGEDGGGGDGIDPLHSVADGRTDPAAEWRHVGEVARRVSAGVDVLTERHRLVVTRRFGLDGEKPKRFREIGEELGVSTERARQILAQAIGRMRKSSALSGLSGRDLCFRDATERE